MVSISRRDLLASLLVLPAALRGDVLCQTFPHTGKTKHWVVDF